VVNQWWCHSSNSLYSHEVGGVVDIGEGFGVVVVVFGNVVDGLDMNQV
jgi:hypothetical protein